MSEPTDEILYTTRQQLFEFTRNYVLHGDPSEGPTTERERKQTVIKSAFEALTQLGGIRAEDPKAVALVAAMADFVFPEHGPLREVTQDMIDEARRRYPHMDDEMLMGMLRTTPGVSVWKHRNKPLACLRGEGGKG